jgi:hypothetical protein
MGSIPKEWILIENFQLFGNIFFYAADHEYWIYKSFFKYW